MTSLPRAPTSFLKDEEQVFRELVRKRIEDKLSTSSIYKGKKYIFAPNPIVHISPDGGPISVEQNGNRFTNQGATALAVFELPPAAIGLFYSFFVVDDDGIQIVAAAGDRILINTDLTAFGGHVDNVDIGAALELVAVNQTEWVALSAIGAWTVT